MIELTREEALMILLEMSRLEGFLYADTQKPMNDMINSSVELLVEKLKEEK